MNLDVLKKWVGKFISKDLQLMLRKKASLARLIMGTSRRSLLQREKELGIIGEFIKPGDTVLDIGANFGVYTYDFSKLVGQDGKVYSFEPIPETYERLCYSIDKLNLKNVEVFDVALSDQEGSCSMTVPVDEYGREILGLAHIGDDKSKSSVNYQIKLNKLSSMNLDLSNLAFIKCDVEGAELGVLKGSEDILREYMPTLLIEIESRHLERYGSSPVEVVSLLKGIGYQAHYYDGVNLVECQEVDNQHFNYIFK